MKNHRSAMGKIVDMNSIIAKNETVRAVGNMPVNARGDTIDQFGKVVKTATTKVNDSYNKTVGNKSANPIRTNTSPTKKVEPKVDELELTPFEKEIEDNFEEDLEIEKIKQEEIKKQQSKKGKK
jgi:hypothetical protein